MSFQSCAQCNQMSFFNANQAAFVTSTSLALGTAASVFLAVTAIETIAIGAFGFLAVTFGALAGASITAWFAATAENTNASASNYFKKFHDQAGYAIVAVYQFVAQTFLTALIQGAANGISKNVSRRIAGPDITVGHI